MMLYHQCRKHYLTSLWIFVLLFTSSTIKSVQSLNLFFNDFFGNDFILFPKIRCSIAAWRFGFDISAFDRYNNYFRSDSIVELSQAGKFIGADNIEDYVKFAFAGFSQYLVKSDSIKNSIEFLGYENGQCVALALTRSSYVLNPNTTNAPAPFDIVNMIKVYYDFEQRYVSRMNVFFTNDFMRIVFDKFLNSDLTRNFVCNTINGPCSSILNTTINEYINENNSTCATLINALPTTEGTAYYIDGKSQGCRALHAVFANSKPTTHCFHLSFTPFVDKEGNIRCQTSQSISPSDLFTEKEMQTYKSFAESVGIDPIKGHTSNE